MNKLTQTEELTRKKIHSILGQSKQIICMADVRIYTTSKESENNPNNNNENPITDEWLYSNIEGNLCYVLDSQKKTRYLRLYEPITFQLLFHMDVYENFSNFYTTIENNFHCFEFNNIFIGLYFLDASQANNFSLMTKKLNDMIVQIMLESENKEKESRAQKKSRFIENINMLKKKFKSEEKYSDDYCEDIMEINKPLFYDLLSFMHYNREKKEFEVGNVPKEFKNLFKTIGIKKHQLKKADTTLSFFKYFIQSFDLINTKNQRKVSNLSDSSDEEILNESENYNNDRKNTTFLNHLTKNKKEEFKNNKALNPNKPNNQNNNNIPSIPSIPAIPVVPGIPSSANNTSIPTAPIPSAPKMDIPAPPKINIPPVGEIPSAPKVIINFLKIILIKFNYNFCNSFYLFFLFSYQLI